MQARSSPARLTDHITQPIWEAGAFSDYEDADAGVIYDFRHAANAGYQSRRMHREVFELTLVANI